MTPAASDFLKRLVQRGAAALGFQICGIAPADPLPEDGARLADWLGRGCGEGMPWLAASAGQRADPRALLPGARSVVLLGMSYAQALPVQEGPPEGRLARFALGRDYHAVVGERIDALARLLAPHLGAGAGCRGFVDTAPLLERAFARRAGLGFIGKNNCLIHPLHGSWFVLGGLAVPAEMPPDAEIPEQCGDCRRCVEACPTGALTAPRRLDARRCLSRLTIEHRGPLGEAMQAALGDRLLGCDRCQEVCPFNAFPLACAEPALSPAAGVGVPRLKNLLATPSNRVYNAQWRGSALARPGRRALVRNAALVAGNLGRRDLWCDLRRLASDPAESPVVREAAGWSLGRQPEKREGTD